MPKSAVLRLLSEMIKSYSSCTRLITNYTYHSGQSELVVEVTYIVIINSRTKYK